VALDFDLICLGSGPAGQRAAVQAAKVGAKVAVVSSSRLGGGCINTGTIPSKTLREAVIDLSGLRQSVLYGIDREGPPVTIEQLLARTRDVIQRERDVIHDQLARNQVQVFEGFGRFEGPTRIVVAGQDGERRLAGRFILLAVGSRPWVPPELPADHEIVITSDDVLALPRVPRRMVVAGAGVIGVEYASMFGVLGTDVSLCDVRPTFLDMVDGEVRAHFRERLEKRGVRFHLGEQIDRVEADPVAGHRVVMRSGLTLGADAVLISAGRQGETENLSLEKAGLQAVSHGRLLVNEHFQTAVPHIYAAGDVIGAPQLAATSAEQGRLAACHAFGIPAESVPSLFPFGIYAIPEIGWVGKTEEELKALGVEYETGVARYGETARGNILGDGDGVLKLLIHRHTRAILGVWICGASASELVHIGQAVIALDGKLDYFLRTVFNYPTLAECYKVAALNGMNKLSALGGHHQMTAVS
jgi:NAD(P) transhydrogenase